MRRDFLFLISQTARILVDAAAFVSSSHKNTNKRNKNAAVVVVAHQSSLSSSSSSSASTVSHSDINSNSVVAAIDELFPPHDLDQRIALSRKDGYWPYLSAGDEAPRELVYGEFDVTLFFRALDRASELLLLPGGGGNTTTTTVADDDIVFCDLGSGTGRLVLAAAALHPTWKLCRGIELLPGIHAQALENVEACRRTRNDNNNNNNDDVPLLESAPPQQQQQAQAQTGSWKQFQQYSPSDDWLNQLSDTVLFDDEDDDLVTNYDDDDEANDNGMEEKEADDYYELVAPNNQQKEELRLAPIQLTCGSFDNPYESFFGDANIVFCFSSAMPYHIMVQLARAAGRQCLPGTLVLTTDYKLPLGGILEALPDDPEHQSSQGASSYELELVERMTGLCTAVGGESVVYIHRVIRSLGTGIPLITPELPVSEMAFRVIQELEGNQEVSQKNFLRKVSNQMAFLGLPYSWRPKVIRDDDEKEEKKSRWMNGNK